MGSEFNRTMTRRAMLGMLGIGGVTLAANMMPPVSAQASSKDDTLNVLDYGAAGDGQKDDSRAIQQVLDACAKAGGGTVYFPNGTYLLHSRLTVGHNTRLVGKAKLVKPYNNVIDILNLAGNHIEIDGLSTENLNEKAGININISRDCRHIVIRNCKFAGIRSQGVAMNATGIAHVLIQDCLFESVTYGVLCNYMADDLEDLRIIGNQFLDIYGDAIELNSPIMGTKKAVYEAAGNIIIANNFISVPKGKGTGDTAGFGIGMAGVTRVSVIGNIIKNCRYEAIHVEDHCRNISITANIIDGVQDDPDNQLNSGIYVLNAEQIAVIGNEIRNCKNYGVHFEYSKENQGNKATIVGNNITNCGSGGIRYAGNEMSDAAISDNIITDNAGSGICLAGSSHSIQVKNNIVRANKGHGIRLEQSKMVSISGNTVYENDGECIHVEKPTFSIPVGQSQTILNFGTSGSSSQWKSAVSLGTFAEGYIHLVAKQANLHCSKLFRLTWDETELKIKLLKENGSGGVHISVPRMKDKQLEVNAYSDTPTMADLVLDVQYEGIIMLN